MPGAIVLGGGMVGGVIARDLAGDPALRVCVADVDEGALSRVRSRSPGLETVAADLSDPRTVERLVEPFDVVCGALSSHLGFGALEAVIRAGKPYCDISFMPEDPLELGGLARERGVTAVVDCGVAPGMSHLFAGEAARTLDSCASIVIYVGGVPKDPKPPFYYKAAFSPRDVIEEYTRPVRIVEGGETVTREALTGAETVEFAGVGALEARLTDGLRSLAQTLDVPEMVEKTLRYPGHYDVMRAMRDAGFFGAEAIEVHGREVVPLDVTTALMFPHWRYEDGEADLTVMRVEAVGTLDGAETRLAWELVDEFDAATGTTSMARTTAFPCAIVARMLLAGEVEGPGVVVPERLAEREGVTDRVLDELRRRGVDFRFSRRDGS